MNCGIIHAVVVWKICISTGDAKGINTIDLFCYRDSWWYQYPIWEV